MTAGYEQTSNTADSLGPGAPHHPAQLLKPPMKKAAVKKAAAKKPQRKTSMLASGSMAVGIVEMPDLEPALEAPLANALAGSAVLCRYGNHQPAGS